MATLIPKRKMTSIILYLSPFKPQMLIAERCKVDGWLRGDGGTDDDDDDDDGDCGDFVEWFCLLMLGLG